MRRRSAILLLVLFSLTAPALGQKPKPEAAGTLVKVGEITGTLTHVEASQKFLSVQYKRQAVGRDGQLQQVPIDLEMEGTDNLVIRRMQLPLAFDERGKPRRHTDAELKQLKGPDPKQPGYQGEFDNLKPGQAVLVTLFQRKDTSKKSAAPSKAKKPVDLTAEALLKLAEQPRGLKERFVVTRVVILSEAKP